MQRRNYIKRRKPIRRRSDKKKLRDEIGALHLKMLKIKRGEQSELTGKTNVILGRFHIIPVSECPRLEFHDENVLLSEWYGDKAHFAWHHDYYKAKEIEKRIIELRGPDYREKLLVLNVTAPKLTMFILQLILESYRQVMKEFKQITEEK